MNTNHRSFLGSSSHTIDSHCNFRYLCLMNWIHNESWFLRIYKLESSPTFNSFRMPKSYQLYSFFFSSFYWSVSPVFTKSCFWNVWASWVTCLFWVAGMLSYLLNYRCLNDLIRQIVHHSHLSIYFIAKSSCANGPNWMCLAWLSRCCRPVAPAALS